MSPPVLREDFDAVQEAQCQLIESLVRVCGPAMEASLVHQGGDVTLAVGMNPIHVNPEDFERVRGYLNAQESWGEVLVLNGGIARDPDDWDIMARELLQLVHAEVAS